MALKVGSKVETLVDTPYTAYDPYSKMGTNYYNYKYPKGTTCVVVHVGESMVGVKHVDDVGYMSDIFLTTWYDFDQIKELG